MRVLCSINDFSEDWALKYFPWDCFRLHSDENLIRLRSLCIWMLTLLITLFLLFSPAPLEMAWINNFKSLSFISPTWMDLAAGT